MLKPKAPNLNSPATPVRAPATTARIIPRSDHTISRSGISPNALRVLYRLREGGFQAFLVGGCVRDLLLGIEPKDFDVATDALPEEVRKLFRNCRLIGRRFRLAHVYFGRDIIEVATFRAATAPSPGQEPLPDPDAEEDEESQTDREDADVAEPANAEVFGDADTERLFDKTGRIIYDNVYGTVDEDVWRRDFTANALYYNIADFSLWDYVGGFEDIAAHRLKLIGDPDTRYREDPVRMLRAARFEAKLGFDLDPATAEPLAVAAQLFEVFLDLGERRQLGAGLDLGQTRDPLRLDFQHVVDFALDIDQAALRAIHAFFGAGAGFARARQRFE